MRLRRDEQIGLVTCIEGHHSLLADSRDYWADITQGKKPKQSKCKCGSLFFDVHLAYEFRENGDVRSIEVLPACCNCARPQPPMLLEIKYSPTDQLVSMPLDAIDQPWLHAKRKEITCYWQPSDAQDFALHLVQSLKARVFCTRSTGKIEECEIQDVPFLPELKSDLYFTNDPDLPSFFAHREPHRVAPFLRLFGPFHILLSFPDDVALLHYIEYSEEIPCGADICKQPPSFLNFALQAKKWLGQNYVSSRGKDTADNPAEYARIWGVLIDSRRFAPPSPPAI
jgi:hypothetical protein